MFGRWGDPLGYDGRSPGEALLASVWYAVRGPGAMVSSAGSAGGGNWSRETGSVVPIDPPFSG